MITLIAAMTKDRIIGKQGQLPWNIPEDLVHFRRVTSGHTIIMGKTTYLSIGKPLPNRRNVVISTSMQDTQGVEVCRSLEEAFEVTNAKHEEVFVIGGASIYEQALPFADKLIISHIEKNYEGDTRFPAFSEHDWRATNNEKGNGFHITTYTRHHEHKKH